MAGLSVATFSRRRLLQVGGIGALGLTLPEMLQAGSSTVGGGRGTPERSCIFIVQYGGGSHIDSFDPKPEVLEDIRGPYRPIATRAGGIQLCELLPRLATQANRFAIVRSMTHGNGGHDGGMHVAMTGHSMPETDTPYFDGRGDDARRPPSSRLEHRPRFAVRHRGHQPSRRRNTGGNPPALLPQRLQAP
jgi:hypothetical protein